MSRKACPYRCAGFLLHIFQLLAVAERVPSGGSSLESLFVVWSYVRCTARAVFLSQCLKCDRVVHSGFTLPLNASRPLNFLLLALLAKCPYRPLFRAVWQASQKAAMPSQRLSPPSNAFLISSTSGAVPAAQLELDVAPPICSAAAASPELDAGELDAAPPKLIGPATAARSIH